MATRTWDRIDTPLDGSEFQVWKMAGVAAGDTLATLLVASFSDKTIYFLKGSAFGGDVALTGQPAPGALFVTLKEPDGTAISGKTSDGAFTCLQHSYGIQPTVGAGVSGVYIYAVCSSTR